MALQLKQAFAHMLVLRISLVLLVSVLSGCAPPYVQPIYVNSANDAKIVESKIHVWTPRLPSIVVNIVAVDNHVIGQFGSATEIVAPGLHQITFGAFYPDGIGPDGDIGNFDLVANFRAGQTYYVQSTEPKLSWDNVVRAQAWIIDSAGNVVSTSTLIRLGGPPVILP
jgi:hypothetical protein